MFETVKDENKEVRQFFKYHENEQKPQQSSSAIALSNQGNAAELALIQRTEEKRTPNNTGLPDDKKEKSAGLPGLSLQLRSNNDVCQLKSLTSTTLNVAGEGHKESDEVRKIEERFCAETCGPNKYWHEDGFRFDATKDENQKVTDSTPIADSFLLRMEQTLGFIRDEINLFRNPSSTLSEADFEEKKNEMSGELRTVYSDWTRIVRGEDRSALAYDKLSSIEPLLREIQNYADQYLRIKYADRLIDKSIDIISSLEKAIFAFFASIKGADDIRPATVVCAERSDAMHKAANTMYKTIGVWKIGDRHRAEIYEKYQQEIKYNLLSKDEFETEFYKWFASKTPTPTSTSTSTSTVS